MYTADDIRAEFERLDKLFFIDTSKVEIAFSKRAVNRLGCCQCKKTVNGTWFPVKIIIADFLRNGDPSAFWDTVRHEYAHAAAAILTGKNCGHNSIWKNICRKIGCSDRARAKSTEESRQREWDAAKYVVTCLGCGEESLYIRKTELIKRLEAGGPSGVICTVCKSKKFKLTYRT